MKRLPTLAALSLAVGLTSAAPLAQAQSFVQVRDWDVYVDTPTRFAYVKVPTKGWIFVRQLDEAQMTRLPARTLTRLLPPEQPEIELDHPALHPSPRMLARATEQKYARAAGALQQ